jgi:hypothetical protein
MLHATLGYRSPEEYEQDYYKRGDCEREEETLFIEQERKAAPTSTCPPKRGKPNPNPRPDFRSSRRV